MRSSWIVPARPRGPHGAAAALPGYVGPAGMPARVRGATAGRGGGSAAPGVGSAALGLRGIGPLERGNGDAPVSNRLGVVAERDGRIGMAGDLRHQPDLDALRLQRRDKGMARQCGVTYGSRGA